MVDGHCNTVGILSRLRISKKLKFYFRSYKGFVIMYQLY